MIIPNETPIQKESSTEVQRRPVLELCDGKFILDFTAVRVVMRRNMIHIGCTDVTVEAAKKILELHAEKFPKVEERVVIQP